MIKELKYISLAHKLNLEHHSELMKHQLHYRGNQKSLSLISLSKETPELGESNIRTETTALKRLDDVISGKIKFELGRSTREKELQAWLISDALSNQNKLYFDSSLIFISSELALYRGEDRIVNDILAIDADNNLVVIELKSTRDKKRIELQVANFTNIIQENKPFFTELTKLITGKQWNGQTKGIVVWPHSHMMKRVIDPKYREICYFEKGEKGNKKIDYDSYTNIQFKEIA